MGTRTVVNEGATCYVVFTYEDKTGNPIIPSSVTYKIDDLTNGVNIVPTTNVSPLSGTSSDTVKITNIENAMNAASGFIERRRVTVNVTAVGGDERPDVSYYELWRIDKTN